MSTYLLTLWVTIRGFSWQLLPVSLCGVEGDVPQPRSNGIINSQSLFRHFLEGHEFLSFLFSYHVKTFIRDSYFKPWKHFPLVSVKKGRKLNVREENQTNFLWVLEEL